MLILGKKYDIKRLIGAAGVAISIPKPQDNTVHVNCIDGDHNAYIQHQGAMMQVMRAKSGANAKHKLISKIALKNARTDTVLSTAPASTPPYGSMQYALELEKRREAALRILSKGIDPKEADAQQLTNRDNVNRDYGAMATPRHR